MGVTPDLLMVGPNGARSSTEMRNGVRLESSKLDAKMLMAALQQVVRWIVYWNLRRVDDRALPVLRTVFEDAPLVSAQSFATGYVRVNEQRASDGLPALSDEEGGNRFIPPPAPAGAAFSAAPQSTTAAVSDVPATPAAPGSAPAASPFPDSAPSTGMPSLSATTQSLPMSSHSRTSRAVFARAQR